MYCTVFFRILQYMVEVYDWKDNQSRNFGLGGMGSLATLLGLLGTVMGLIEAFTVVAKAPADQKSALLSAAIGVAMNTTAFGLMVAIPTILIFMTLTGITKKITNEIDYYSVRLENLLYARGKGE